MFYIRLRLFAVAALAVGIAFGGASVYVHGLQQPAADDGRQVSKRPKTSSQVPGKPATAAPRAKLRAQQLATRKAKATYEIAKSTRELAEIAVEEYQEVSYPRELAEIEREIKLAKADLTRSEDRVERARKFEKKYIEPAHKVTEELNFQKAKFALEQSQSRLQVLEQYTKTKTIKELKSEVEKSLADEQAKKQAWNLENAKEIELEGQLNLKTN
jgi:HlyD family secretion protein